MSTGIRGGTCRGCGAEIVWIQTPAGKSMPCDAEAVPYWQRKGGHAKIVTPGGEVVSAELTGMPGMQTGWGYMSHFATCPRSEDFRRAK